MRLTSLITKVPHHHFFITHTSSNSIKSHNKFPQQNCWHSNYSPQQQYRQQDPLSKYKLQFINQNTIIFASKTFPSTYQIQKRAQILAKLYLLGLYREQSRKLLIMDRNEQTDLEKKRQINKIKHEMDIQKMRQGELIEDMDLLKQVYKIRDLIERKMNAIAYEEFKSKNGVRATEVKKSLEKLKEAIDAQSVPKLKLKMLIAYKYKKGW